MEKILKMLDSFRSLKLILLGVMKPFGLERLCLPVLKPGLKYFKFQRVPAQQNIIY